MKEDDDDEQKSYSKQFIFIRFVKKDLEKQDSEKIKRLK